MQIIKCVSDYSLPIGKYQSTQVKYQIVKQNKKDAANDLKYNNVFYFVSGLSF